MSRPVYSTRFLWGQNSTIGAYTVPAGFIAVVRDWDAYSDNVAPVRYSYLNITPLGGTGLNLDFFVTDLDSTVQHQWRGRQVLYPGDLLRVASTQGIDYMVSGYLLTTP